MVNLPGLTVLSGAGGHGGRRHSRHTLHQPSHRHYHHHQHLQHPQQSSGGLLHVHSSQSQTPGIHLGRPVYASGTHFVPQHQRSHSCSSSHDEDSLSSLSMLSAEQSKRKVRWILSLGLLLPALAAIIGMNCSLTSNQL